MLHTYKIDYILRQAGVSPTLAASICTTSDKGYMCESRHNHGVDASPPTPAMLSLCTCVIQIGHGNIIGRVT